MIFKSLKLNNIRSYKTHKIQFPIGTTLFEGDIGSGKSSILMAIEFALFGLGNQKGDAILRKGVKNGSVSLEFSVNNNNYRIERNLSRKDDSSPVRQAKGLLTVNGKKNSYSPTEIKEKVLEILNFNEPVSPKSQSFIFRYAIYTPQEEMKNILSQKPDSRLQTLRKAFGIEDYKIAIENSLIISNHLKEIKRYLDGQIVDLNQKKQDLKNLRESRLENKNDLSTLTQNLEKCDLKFKLEEKELDALKASESKINQIKAQIPLLENQIKDKKKLVEKYRLEIRKLENENLDLNSKTEELKKVLKPSDLTELEVKEIIGTLNSTISKRKETFTKISVLNDNKTKLNSELVNLNYNECTDFQNEINSILNSLELKKSLLAEKEEIFNQTLQTKYQIKAFISEINQKIDNLDGLGDICPICDSQLDDTRKSTLQNERKTKLNEKSNELAIIDETEKKTNLDLENLRSEITTYNNRLHELEFVKNKKEQINSLDIELNKLNNAIINLDNYISSFKMESSNSDPQFLLSYYQEKLDNIRHFNNLQQDISNLNDHLSRNKVKISENKIEIESTSENIEKLLKNLSESLVESEKLNNLSIQIAEFKKTHDETKSMLETLKENFIKTKTLLDSLENEIERINNEITTKEQIKQRSNVINDNYIWIMDFLIPTLSLIEKKRMEKIFIDFNSDFQKWFRLLIDDYSMSVKINEEFTPIVEQDGYEQEINYLSGGEKTSVAFAYRLALNSAVKKESATLDSNVLILDEPTDGFSKEQLFKIRDIFDELKTEQLIIVSHEQELESFADHTFRVEKVDGYSTIVDL